MVILKFNFFEMKIIKIKILNIAAVLVLTCLLGACGKNIFETEYADYPGKVMMAQAAEGRNAFSIPMSSKPFKLGFGAFWGGSTTTAPGDIPVEFGYKEDWIAQYNAQNGTNYVALPSGSYNITGLSSMIKQGNTTSEPLSISIESKKLDITKKYMFPITLISAGSERIDSALRTTWFRIENVVRSERDVTNSPGNVFTVSHDHNGGADAGEGSKKLIDNNTASKFLVSDMSLRGKINNFWYQMAFASPIILGAYTMTSGNDAPERDPRDWKLMGSNDGSNWTDLDVKTGQAFSGRNMTVRYEFANNTAYKYYRLQITLLQGGLTQGLFQQSEWRLIEFYEQ